MKKSKTINTFEQGMIMDLNPSVTPNNVLTNCLNGTLLTFNGNENVLQQDQGNGRVETAYLPTGYIPLGTAELGGIIYIVSYNPLINKCQIGSFPSPERNISTQEIPTTTITVNNSQFTDGQKVLSTLVRVKLLTNSTVSKLNPGDKYIIYSTNGGITNNSDKISDVGSINHQFDDIPRYITIHVVSIGEDGKITYLDDTLNWFNKTNDDGSRSDYYIRESDIPSDQIGQWDTDEYRTLTSTAYNVFNSKVSGELALLFEVRIIDSFSVTWDATVSSIDSDENGNDKEATITFNINYTSNNQEINLKYVIITDSELTNISGDDLTNYYCDISEYTQDRLNDGTDADIPIEVSKFRYNSSNTLNNYIWNYRVTPAMQFGQLDFLSTSGFINFSEIGSGKIQLDEWRYFIQDTNFYLNWGLSAYVEKNKSISKVIFTFIPFDSIDQDELMSTENPEIGYTQYPQYIISGKSTYSGFFKELINFDENSKIQNGTIQKDYLYLVDICIVYANEFIHIYRWLYTTPQWNSYYSTETDFNNLYLNSAIKFNSISNVTDNISLDTEVFTSNVQLPEQIEENQDEQYRYMGAQVTTVGYNKSSGFSSNLPNVGVEVIVECSYENLFKFQSNENDKYTFSIKETSISHDDFSATSDKLSNISSYVLPKIAEQDKDNQITIHPELGTTIKTVLNEGIKNDTVNNKAIDSFSIITQSSLNNTFIFQVLGALFSRINADLIETTTHVEQLIRPLLYYTDDYRSLGFFGDNNKLNLFIESHYDAGRGEPFSFVFLNRDNESERIDSWADLKWDTGDKFKYNNWYEVVPYASYLNPWMISKGGTFQIMHWMGDDKKVDSIRFGELMIEGYVSIWGKTTEGRFIPINYFLPANGNEGEDNINSIVKSLYASVYYVDINGMDLDIAVVDNINYMHLYNETWNIKISVLLEVANMDDSIILQNKLTLSDLKDKCNTIKNSDGTSLNLHNISYSDSIPSTIQLNDIDVSHTFQINNSELYDQYSNDKSVYIGAAAVLSTQEGIKKCNPKNDNGKLYVYDQNTNDFIGINRNCFSKTYRSGTFDESDSEIDSSKKRVLLKDPTVTSNKPIELYDAIEYRNGEMVLSEGKLLVSIVTMHFKTTAKENEKDHTSKINFNSAYGLT